ncbi:MAG: carbamoyl-phosphate synthase large subunit [Glaciecola sp.]
MEKKTILVTGIGGNVGQGIIRNIRSLGYPLKIVGTNNVAESAGNHLVDQFVSVPLAYEPDYLPRIKEIIATEQVDLIIPSTDYEMFFLATSQDTLACKVACGGPVSVGVYLDKYETSLFHVEHNIPFASSVLPSKVDNQFSPLIAKPRKGRGSRGIVKNIIDCSKLQDEEYLVQELVEGTEITTTAYVSFLTGKLVGVISMERSLDNGATTYCKVNSNFDSDIIEIAKAIMNSTDVKGSFNIQSMVDSDRKVTPFEINCRISGTNSIRSHFGFPDVKYTVNELLYGKEAEKPAVIQGTAYRYLADVIYPHGLNTGDNSDDFKLF